MADEKPKLLKAAVIDVNLGADTQALRDFLKAKYGIDIPGDNPKIEVLVRTGCVARCPTDLIEPQF